MSDFVLNDQTAKTPLGELLSSATGEEIRITDESGKPVARILFPRRDESAGAVEEAEREIDELRKRRNADRSEDVTTRELLEFAEKRSAE